MIAWDVFLGGEKWVTTQEMSSFMNRLRGFMCRRQDSLKVDALWFPDCSAVHTCFMRFPLDLYYLDADHQIIAVHQNVSGWRLISQRGADSVLEIPSGSQKVAEEGMTLRFQKCL